MGRKAYSNGHRAAVLNRGMRIRSEIKGLFLEAKEGLVHAKIRRLQSMAKPGSKQLQRMRKE
jgi:hypothetical protein